MADNKDNIAMDPSNILNVQKALAGVNIEMRKGTQQADLMNNIQKKLVEGIKSRGLHERALLVTNMNIEATVNRIKLLEEARFKQLRDRATLTKKITEETVRLQGLLRSQSRLEEKITAAALKKAQLGKQHEALANSIKDITSKQFGTLLEISDTWQKTGSRTLTVLTIAKQIVDIFDKLDTSAFEFRQEMGFTRKFTQEIDEYARAGAVNMAQLSVGGKEMYEAAAAISKELFTSANITQTMMDNVALISTQLGISASSTADLVKNLGIAGRTAGDLQQSTVLFATALSEAAGTPLKDVMADVSNATKNMYQFVSKSGMSMIKAAVEAKRMGTSVESATKSSASLLNFTQNVKDEMEASVLVGKSINLQKARELAYHRDIRGLNAEILNIMKQVDFENLDPFQQDAVARALGKSAGELANMAQAERERRNMLKAMTPEQRKQFDLYEKMMGMGQKQKKDYAEVARKQLEQMSNQTRLNAIGASWNKIMMRLAQIFLPAIDKTLAFIAKHFDLIVNLSAAFFGWMKPFPNMLTKIGRLFMWIGSHVRAWGTGLSRIPMIGSKIAPIFEFVAGIFTKVGRVLRIVAIAIRIVFVWLGRAGGFIGKFFGFIKPLAGVGAAFGKWITPIGWIITGIMFVINLFNRFKGITKNLDGTWKGVGKMILAGLKAIGLALYDTLIEPFVHVIKWILGWFGAHSPSKIGLMIWKGIKAVGGMVLEALLSPYKLAWMGIKKIASGIMTLFGSKIGQSVIKGMKAAGTFVLEALLFPYKTAWNVIKKIPFVSKLFGGKNVSADVVPEAKALTKAERPKPEVDVKKSSGSLSEGVSDLSDQFTKKISDVVDAINALRDDMKNGSLTANVYIDSQKLDSIMGRRLAYTGQLV